MRGNEAGHASGNHSSSRGPDLLEHPREQLTRVIDQPESGSVTHRTHTGLSILRLPRLVILFESRALEKMSLLQLLHHGLQCLGRKRLTV
jgi:hypothetical protein